MNFYTGQHKFYCGIDLHARKMYLCILDAKGEVKLHRNMNTDRNTFLRAIEPYREDLVVAVECMFAWYWTSRSLPEGGYSVCPRSCSVYESHSWRKGEERQDRFPQDRRSLKRRHDSHVLCISGEDAGNARPHTKEELSRKEESRTFSPYPEYE